MQGTKLFLIPVLIFLMSVLTYSQNNLIFIKHKSYCIWYDTILKIPIQANYNFTYKNLGDQYKRTQFTLDKNIPREYQSTKSINTKIYDRGHLCPNDDFRFDSISQKESMYYTNQAAQVKELNRGVWKGIENYVRLKGKFIAPKDSMIIRTGVITTSRIPDFFWKCIEYKNSKECFICANKKELTTNKVITTYKINIDSMRIKYKIDIK